MLDIAGGTGDIAFRLLDYCTLINHDPHSRIIVSDINPSMLSVGRKRSLTTPYAHSNRLEWLEADAESLPSTIPSNSIDLYTIAFGIRNFTHPSLALREAFRVLKPGGVFACLEFSHITSPLPAPLGAFNPLAAGLMNGVYKRWGFGAIPLLGQLVAGDRDSYQYLVESIEKWKTQKEFRDMIADAGFLIPGGGGEDGDQKGWEDLTGGVAAIHRGVKPLV
ncbi:MAG: hypothetical protein Q9190_003235 [Brigantiaea leucoxantha]